MANRTYETNREQQNEGNTAVPDTHQPAAPELTMGLGQGVEKDTAVLQRRTNGRLARAGTALAQLQRSHGNRYVQRVVDSNRTGLPDDLKTGVENLSGLSLNDVRVHYNSPKPAQLEARAYTQGTEIHVAPGQTEFLPHEIWHVVQQMQGRVNPTMQIGQTDINNDALLEHEADVMGAKASQVRHSDANVNPTALPESPTKRQASSTPVIQGLFDWAINARHNVRKVGVEITENNTGWNRLIELQQDNTPWAVAAPPWAATVNLPDDTGAAHNWHVAQTVNVVPTFYRQAAAKRVWMKWGDVSLTEDHGDYEWIVKHPAQPQGVTYYRDRLAEVSQARATLRNALQALGLGASLVLSHAANGYGVTALFSIPASTGVTSQITFESVDPNITRQALMEGISQGLVRSQLVNRSDFLPADAAVVNMVNTAAARSVVPNVDMRLIMAYIVGDLTHKIATLVSGPLWTNAAANFKDWRILFPKSHPYQVLVQALSTPPTINDINLVQVALNLDQANIIADVLNLFAQKLVGLEAANRWQPAYFTGGKDPGGHITNAIIGTAPPVPGPTLDTLLNNFLNANVPGFLATEFTNVVDALTDPTSVTHVNVVRSSGFAQHPGSSKGVAFEDRAEVADNFPGLGVTYTRIQNLVDRY